MLEGVPNVLIGRSIRARRVGVDCAMSKNFWHLGRSANNSGQEVAFSLLDGNPYSEQRERAVGVRADKIGCPMDALSTAH